MTGLVGIFSGRTVDDVAVNVHNSVEIGTSQWLEYERQWSAGFHKKLTKKGEDHGSSNKTDRLLNLARTCILWIPISLMHVSLEL